MNPKKQLEEILEQEEYQAYQKVQEGPLHSLRETIINWLEGLVKNLFPNASFQSPGVEALIYVIGFFGIGLLIFLIVRLTQSTKRQSELKKSSPLTHSSHLEWTYREHLQEAEKREREGELREATRHVFLALLLHFDDRDYIAVRIWKSNGEYVEELTRVDRSLAKTFREFAIFFDRVTYGGQSISREQFRSYHQNVLSLIREGSEGAYEGE